MSGALTEAGADRRGRPRSPRILLIVAALALVGSAAGLGLLLAVRAGRVPGVDEEWMSELAEHRNGPITDIALVFDQVGGGIVGTYVVPLAVLGLLLVLRRWWAAVLWVVSVALSAAVIQAIKNLVDRARPADMLVVSDHGSFPSGHTANAATTAAVLAIVFWRWWVTTLGVLWTLAMAFSRTYLGAHWLTDTVGGILVGVGIALLVWGVLGARLATRRRRTGASAGRAPLPSSAPAQDGGADLERHAQPDDQDRP